jgi:hypothetical protein
VLDSKSTSSRLGLSENQGVPTELFGMTVFRKGVTQKLGFSGKHYLGEYKHIVLDEAQQISNIGLTLKVLTETFPQIQVITTGSSSFDILNKENSMKLVK